MTTTPERIVSAIFGLATTQPAGGGKNHPNTREDNKQKAQF